MFLKGGAMKKQVLYVTIILAICTLAFGFACGGGGGGGGSESFDLLLFAGIIFSHHFFELPYLFRSIAGFFLFSLTASSIYILNDIMDREKDLAHPVKRNRAIPSGRLSLKAAWIGIFLLAVPALAAGFLMWRAFGFCLLVYFLLNLAYSLRLKHVVLLDVLTISIGFLIRAIAGYRASGLWARCPALPAAAVVALKAALLSGGLIQRDIPYEAIVDDTIWQE